MERTLTGGADAIAPLTYARLLHARAALSAYDAPQQVRYAEQALAGFEAQGNPARSRPSSGPCPSTGDCARTMDKHHSR
jgi:hypothetical protein